MRGLLLTAASLGHAVRGDVVCCAPPSPWPSVWEGRRQEARSACEEGCQGACEGRAQGEPAVPRKAPQLPRGRHHSGGYCPSPRPPCRPPQLWRCAVNLCHVVVFVWRDSIRAVSELDTRDVGVQLREFKVVGCYGPLFP